MEPRSLVAAIDQGTTSSRCILFDRSGRPVASHQLEHAQITPRPGWVEHDADEILERVRTCIRVALRDVGADAGALAAVGISDQRETTVVWSRRTGRPVQHAIVWQDTRTAEAGARLAAADPLGAGPLPGADRAADLDLFVGAQARLDARGGRAGPAIGGRGRRPAVRHDRQLAHLAPDRRRPGGGVHVTDVTNASRTMLMGLESLAWEPELLDADRRPGGDAAGDPLVVRGLRRGGRGPRRRPDRGRPRRPAGGAVRPGLLRGRPDQVHLRHRLLHAHAHRRSARPLAARADHDGRRPPRRRARDVRARGLGGGRRRAHRLAARQPRDHRRRRRGRGARPFRARQRRRRVRAGLLRPVRAALAERRARASSPG